MQNMTYKQQLIVPCAGTAQNLAHDLGKAPMKQSACEHCSNSVAGALLLPRRFGRALIWLYRHTLSPLVGYNCRHLPTCSAYGDEAIERFGLWAGGWMTLARLLRCNPFGTSGIDNVPLTAPQGARWYSPWRYGRWRGVNAS
ncbi:hypothetical protein YidD [Bradyrhizobium sp. WSM471]|nr:hypothetical protein YidD [Bradyrhizobium sp. WSM471]